MAARRLSGLVDLNVGPSAGKNVGPSGDRHPTVDRTVATANGADGAHAAGAIADAVFQNRSMLRPAQSRRLLFKLQLLKFRLSPWSRKP
jgi:hypothetical protein